MPSIMRIKIANMAIPSTMATTSMAITIAACASRSYNDSAAAHDVFVTNGAARDGATQID